jgi:hypothetical protein
MKLSVVHTFLIFFMLLKMNSISNGDSGNNSTDTSFKSKAISKMKTPSPLPIPVIPAIIITAPSNCLKNQTKDSSGRCRPKVPTQ